MNEESKHHPIEPELEARIVALVLGETSDFECDELNRWIAGRPELAAFKLSMQQLHGMLEEVGQGEFEAPRKDWKLPSDKRNAVLAVIRGEATVQQAEQAVASAAQGSAVVKPASGKRNRKWNFGHVAVAVCVLGFMGILTLPSIMNDQYSGPSSIMEMSDSRGALPTIVMVADDIDQNVPDDAFVNGTSTAAGSFRFEPKSIDLKLSLSAIEDSLKFGLNQRFDGKTSQDAELITETARGKERSAGQDDSGVSKPDVFFDDEIDSRNTAGTVVEMPKLIVQNDTVWDLNDGFGTGLPGPIFGRSLAPINRFHQTPEISDRRVGIADQLGQQTNNKPGEARPSKVKLQSEGFAFPVLEVSPSDVLYSAPDTSLPNSAGSGITDSTTWMFKGLPVDSSSKNQNEMGLEVAGSAENVPSRDRLNELQKLGEVGDGSDELRRWKMLKDESGLGRIGVDFDFNLQDTLTPAIQQKSEVIFGETDEKLNRRFSKELGVADSGKVQNRPVIRSIPIHGLGAGIGGKMQPAVPLDKHTDKETGLDFLAAREPDFDLQQKLRAATLAGREIEPKNMPIGKQTPDLNLSLHAGKDADAAQERVLGSQVQMNQQLTPLLLEERLLSEQLGDRHPKLQEVQKRIEQTREYYEKRALESSGEVEANDGKRGSIQRGRSRIGGQNLALPIMIDGEPRPAQPAAQDLAESTGTFNSLMAEDRYSEAELVARKALEVNSDSPESIIMLEKAKLGRQIAELEKLKSRKSDSALDVFSDFEESVTMPLGDYGLPKSNQWSEFKSRRDDVRAIERQVEKEGSVASQSDGEDSHPFGPVPDRFGNSRMQPSVPSGGSLSEQSTVEGIVTESEKLEASKGFQSRSQNDLAQINAMTQQNIAAFSAQQPGESTAGFGVTPTDERVGGRDFNGGANVNLWMKLPAEAKQQPLTRSLISKGMTETEEGNLRYRYAAPDVTNDLSLLKQRTLGDSATKQSKPTEIKQQKVQNRSTASEGLKEKLASTEAFSTFSLHVSDVSFKLAKAALGKAEWPEAAKIRIEEFVNAFDYGDPMPRTGEKVACVVEQSIHPFLQQRNLLRVSMRTAAAGRASSTPLRLTLLLDNSGSMERIDRQQTVRLAFSLLAKQLKPIDHVTLISFARQPRLLADKVSGDKANQLVELFDNLPSEGGTNIEAALQLAFDKAKEHQSPGAQNRIILLTDGAVNLGNANPESLSDMVTMMRTKGIAFDAAGISSEGLNDEILEALTRQGDGRYYLLDSMESADSGFAAQIAGALRPSAKNVKVQVEFNPKRVGKYKLLGFEKHRLKKEDFRNDKVDAAEMAAAEAGVAMYQFEAKPDGEGDVGSVSVRFLDLSSGQMVEHRWPIPYEADAARTDQATPSLRIAASAALLAAKLRNESLGETVDLQVLSALVAGLPEAVRADDRVQSLDRMIRQARQLSGQ